MLLVLPALTIASAARRDPRGRGQLKLRFAVCRHLALAAAAVHLADHGSAVRLLRDRGQFLRLRFRLALLVLQPGVVRLRGSGHAHLQLVAGSICACASFESSWLPLAPLRASADSSNPCPARNAALNSVFSSAPNPTVASRWLSV
jgi:hypothetical protein